MSKPRKSQGAEGGELFPSSPGMGDEIWTKTVNPDAAGGVQMQFNQQINFFGEIQGFEHLEKLSPETKAAALNYLSSEQAARHQFVFNEQKNLHSLRTKGQETGGKIQSQAMLLAAFVFITTLVIAAVLMVKGLTVMAISLILGEVGAAAILVVYGRKIADADKNQKRDDSEVEKD